MLPSVTQLHAQQPLLNLPAVAPIRPVVRPPRLLAEDVVFYSPVVFTPQRGKDVTKLYLGAAGKTLGGGKPVASGSEGGGGFRYTKQILSGNQAVLEFETEMDGKHVNGVDIITCDETGRIVEFKVMIRPLQAIQAVHAAMGRMLKAMQEA